MAFNAQANKSQVLDVTSAGQWATIPAGSPQCRVWNEGPDPCRVVYGDPGPGAADDDMVLPPSFVEVHTKFANTVISAKTESGKTARLHIICGQGD